MTVISAVITKHCTAHASDSLLTEQQRPDRGRPIVEQEKPKVIHVRQWRGALAYWGLAQVQQWSTFGRLQYHAQNAGGYSSPEDFANAIGNDLNQELNRLQLPADRTRGIGIHFTAYEQIHDYWIPELFLISNWTDTAYTNIRPEGVGVSRETFHTLKNVPSAPEHRHPDCRIEVHRWLHDQNGMLIYNNGDPALFNPVANAILQIFHSLMKRGEVDHASSKEVHCAFVRRPIEVVSRLLGDFAKEETRMIGGKPHDLCISPDGTCWSSTGDC
jgi:hypothetical protein